MLRYIKTLAAEEDKGKCDRRTNGDNGTQRHHDLDEWFPTREAQILYSVCGFDTQNLSRDRGGASCAVISNS